MVDFSKYPNYFHELFLDGQHLYTVTNIGINDLLKKPTSLLGNTFSENVWILVANQIRLIQYNKNFQVAAGLVGNKKQVFFYFIFRVNQQEIRVSIEKINCKSCDWVGFIANPLVSDNFIGVPDKQMVYEKLKNIDMKKCPVCNKELARPAICII